jgi:hypothetical protein
MMFTAKHVAVAKPAVAIKECNRVPNFDESGLLADKSSGVSE